MKAMYSTVQYSTVQYNTVQYSTVQYSTIQHSTVQYIIPIGDTALDINYDGPVENRTMWLSQISFYSFFDLDDNVMKMYAQPFW
jgi:hypothetical protein